MRKILISAATVSLLAASSSSAFALCLATGEITRILVAPGPLDNLTTQFHVRPSTPGSNTISFTTGDSRVTSVVAAAQASHERVRVTGANSACSAPSNGLSGGGSIVSVIVAPDP